MRSTVRNFRGIYTEYFSQIPNLVLELCIGNHMISSAIWNK